MPGSSEIKKRREEERFRRSPNAEAFLEIWDILCSRCSIIFALSSLSGYLGKVLDDLYTCLAVSDKR